MGQTTEEARRELAEHMVGHIRDGTTAKAKCCLAAADAYALAVLDEAGGLATVEEFQALRRRIKEMSER